MKGRKERQIVEWMIGGEKKKHEKKKKTGKGKVDLAKGPKSHL